MASGICIWGLYGGGGDGKKLGLIKSENLKQVLNLNGNKKSGKTAYKTVNRFELPRKGPDVDAQKPSSPAVNAPATSVVSAPPSEGCRGLAEGVINTKCAANKPCWC
jgi:hypothetical protein